MSNTNEEIVGRVLHGLRDAAPPDGMESRIVSAVRHRPPSMPAPPRSPWRTAPFAGGAVLAGVVCALFFTAHRKPPRAAFPRRQPISMHAVDGLVIPPASATRTLHNPSVRRARLVTASRPREELAAISYPAPPLPLTEQEELLLKLAHKGDPVQLAMLDPVQRAARYAEERAEVQQFFHPTHTGDDQ